MVDSCHIELLPRELYAPFIQLLYLSFHGQHGSSDARRSRLSFGYPFSWLSSIL